MCPAPISSGEPLGLRHQARLDALLRERFADRGGFCLSAPWFANLYLFREAHAYRFVDGALPYVSGLTYDGVQHILPLFEPATASSDELDALFHSADCLFPLSQSQVDRLDPQRFDWASSRADEDYLYLAQDIRDYGGRLRAKKLNLVRQLLAAHEVQCRTYGIDDLGTCMFIVQEWMAAKGKRQGEADERACLEALAMAPQLGLTGFVYFVGHRPAGFVLLQLLRDDYAVVRFAKGSEVFKGIYQYMFRHAATAFRSVNWLNFEQDMGLPNFRQTKMSYGPAALVPKFRVRVRSR
ncbi:hypothetical protein SRS16CHR_01440 [Variovorax sp. SRS16]|uniref:phosphatidylglycerol lysyltransferase domain-containing protein n=1 Tax=Variovorax sp. SRS16 TaxID=282217 RepID=UPI001318794A|nr:phosphatidylglycerol lysyltransferase domain-containing protein [Variovorax sp. SRS16]VTU15313.1 hypothetical protein SRS16CHR_01440 [Variovorax sp. SRS16]